jgi:hypothetical protein
MIQILVHFRLIMPSAILISMVVVGSYIAFFIDTPLIRSELIWVLALMAVVGSSCWYGVRSEAAKKMNL